MESNHAGYGVTVNATWDHRSIIDQSIMMNNC
jgi:hypothetical protein